MEHINASESFSGSNAKKRKSWNKEEIKTLIENQKSSGLNINQYCRSIGMHHTQFYSLRKRLKDSLEQPKAFVPLQVRETNDPIRMEKEGVVVQLPSSNNFSQFKQIFRMLVEA